jgi:hypothetical protein
VTEEVADLVREIRSQAGKTRSLVVQFRSVYTLQLMPIEASGRIHFLSPDRVRSEATINGREVTTIRKGSLVYRYLPRKKEIWRYDLNDLPQTEPMNFAVADLRDPFFAVDEPTLKYEGIQDLSGSSTHSFTADVKNLSKQGLLDTRKGFSLQYKPRGVECQLRLHIDVETGLLRQMTGTDKTGKLILQTDYVIESTNAELSESIFAVDESTAEYRSIEISDILFSSMNPNAADDPPSLN